MWKSLRDWNSCPGNVGWGFFFKNGRKLNDRMTIPARILHSWTSVTSEFTTPPRPACRTGREHALQLIWNGLVMLDLIKAFFSPAEHSWEKYTHSHTWNYHIMSSVNTAESVSSSCSSFKVSDILLLAVEPRNGESPCCICVQPHPECYSHTGSPSGEQEGRRSPKKNPNTLEKYGCSLLC